MKKPQLGTVLPVVALLPVMLVGLLAFHAVQIWRYAQPTPPACPADTLLVMGAAQYDGEPSPAFQRRLDRALELYTSGCGQKILVTGGRREGDRFSEGEAGRHYLQSRGVEGEALQSETESRTSIENLRFSQGLVAGEKVLLVTDDMHAYRSRLIARRLGIDAEVAPVATQGNRLHYALRELLLVTAYTLGLTR